MKKVINTFVLSILCIGVLAQAPQMFNYQAVLRNDSGEIMPSESITVITEIIKGSASGSIVFTETHNIVTNNYGLMNIRIGSKQPLGVVDWTDDYYFLQVKIDGTPMGAVQLLTVPFAMHATSAEIFTGEFTEDDPTVPQYVKDIEEDDINNWNDAYDWGDHAEVGYLTELSAESDPVFLASPAADIETTDIANWDEAYDWGDHSDANYLTDYTESDPTVPQYVKDIEEDDITNWNSKYEVGDAIDVSSISIGGVTVIDMSGNLVGPAADHWHDASSIVSGVLDISRIPVGTTVSTVAAGDHDHSASHITTGVFPVARGGTGQTSLTNGSFLVGNGTNPVTLRAPAQVRIDIGANNASNITVGTLSIERGGTGATSAAAARSNLDAAASIHSHSLADVLEENNDADENQIKNLADPTDEQDAATKAYVDANAPTTYEIGDLAHGGIVFYVEPCGTKGLVAATEDQSDDIKWRGGSTNYATMARGHELYAGKMNTSIIIAVHSAKDDFDNHAALICANYTGGDFGDWYLPSREELLLMYDNLHNQTPALGGFANTWYWSSSEINASYAGCFYFNNGHTSTNDKNNSSRVRAVRAF